MYDLVGLVALIFTGAFLLMLPIAAALLGIWLFEKAKVSLQSRRQHSLVE
ncbi:MAG: hypothetical protein ACR2L2_19930 [Acidobacteriota bacterium]